MKTRLISILRFLFRRQKTEQDLDRELRYHLDRQTELNKARGMEPEAARREAVLSVGGIEAIKDDCREARTGRFIETLWQDVRATGCGFSARIPILLSGATHLGARDRSQYRNLQLGLHGVLLRLAPLSERRPTGGAPSTGTPRPRFRISLFP